MKWLEFAQSITRGRYGQAKMRKIGKHKYLGDIEATYIAGYCEAINELAEKNNQDNYKTPLELFGDMQIMYSKAHNRLVTKYNIQRDLTSVENLIDLMEVR